MVGAKKVATKGSGYNNQCKGLAAIAHGLHGDEFSINDAHAVVAEEWVIGATDCI
jgi:hypothetical protein